MSPVIDRLAELRRVRNLAAFSEFSPAMVRGLEKLPFAEAVRRREMGEG